MFAILLLVFYISFFWSLFFRDREHKPGGGEGPWSGVGGNRGSIAGPADSNKPDVEF